MSFATFLLINVPVEVEQPEPAPKRRRKLSAADEAKVEKVVQELKSRVGSSTSSSGPSLSLPKLPDIQLAPLVALLYQPDPDAKTALDAVEQACPVLKTLTGMDVTVRVGVGAALERAEQKLAADAKTRETRKKARQDLREQACQVTGWDPETLQRHQRVARLFLAQPRLMDVAGDYSWSWWRNNCTRISERLQSEGMTVPRPKRRPSKPKPSK